MRPQTKVQLQEHLRRIIIKAEQIGLKQAYPLTNPHIFRHRDIDHDFDFSSTAPEKIMLAIWLEAHKSSKMVKLAY